MNALQGNIFISFIDFGGDLEYSIIYEVMFIKRHTTIKGTQQSKTFYWFIISFAYLLWQIQEGLGHIFNVVIAILSWRKTDANLKLYYFKLENN